MPRTPSYDARPRSRVGPVGRVLVVVGGLLLAAFNVYLATVWWESDLGPGGATDLGVGVGVGACLVVLPAALGVTTRWRGGSWASTYAATVLGLLVLFVWVSYLALWAPYIG